jgi:RNA polymerase sigma-70 factor (ECF subfamily)
MNLERRPGDLDSATRQMHRLREGHADAMAWLIRRFTPPLHFSASRRIAAHLQGLYDPEDLVQEVWAVALPRLEGLRDRDGRITPVILRYLGSILINKYRNLMQKHLREFPLPHPGEHPGADGDAVDRLPDDATTVLSGVIRREACVRFREAVERLDDLDQQVVVLRGIEQVSNHDAALILGMPPATVSTRFGRALEKLRRMLPDTVFTDLASDA